MYAVAVELDFMEPLVAGRRLSFQRGELRLDESRHFRRDGRLNNSPRTLGHHPTQKASLPRNPLKNGAELISWLSAGVSIWTIRIRTPSM